MNPEKAPQWKSPGKERDEAIQKKIEEVRGLPQGSKQERAEKQEQAKLLRQELMLDNAQCARLVTAALEYDPDITYEDLIGKLNRSKLLFRQDSAENFVDELESFRDKAKVVLGENLTGSDADFLARALYRICRKPEHLDWQQKGDVEVRAGNIALTLLVSDAEDFEKVDDRKNVGGFVIFDKAAKKGDREVEFPLIVIKASAQPQEIDRVTKHEVGHIQNESLVRSLKEAPGKGKLVWESPPLKAADAVTVQELARKEGVGVAKVSPEWQRILSYAFSNAKHEILAEANTGVDISFTSYAFLLKKGDVYDYFKNRYKLDPESLVYEELWAEYNVQLKRSISVAKDISDIYFTNRLRQRQELFRWVLAQIPLQDWPRQLSGAFFYKEAVQIEKFKARPDVDSTTKMKFIKELWDNENKPLLPVIKKYEAELDEKKRRADDMQFEIFEGPMAQKNEEFKKNIQAGKHNLWDAPSFFLNAYAAECQRRGIERNIMLLNDWLEDEGWTTRRKAS